MAGMVILTFVLFFLAENGRINSFATYFVAIFLLLLIAFDQKQFGSLNWRWLTLPACLLVYFAASGLWSETAESPYQHSGYAGLLFCFLVAFQLCHYRFSTFVTILVNMIIAAAFTSACWSIYLHFLLPDYQPLPEPRLYGLGRLNNPVISATAYGFATILAVHRVLFDQDLRRRLVFGLAIAVFLTAIILSGTRSTWLALLVSIALGLRFLFHGNRQLQIISVTMMSATLVGLLLWSQGSDELLRRALSFRPEIWLEFSSRVINENLLIGVGVATDSTFVLPEITIQHPHSLFVSTFYYGGLIGFALFCLLLGQSAYAVHSSEKEVNSWLCGMLLTYGVVLAIFDGNQLITKVDHIWLSFWFPVALAVSLKCNPATRTEATG